MSKTYEELLDDIREQKGGPFHGLRGSYSHNIIGCVLRIIAEEHGKAKANEAVRTLRLKQLGWAEEPE
jgi:hypothetical protein